MRTPSFKLDQTDDTLKITIKAPFANVAETEIDVDETEFCFSSWPYYLRLHLPGPIEETETSKANYDCDSGLFHFELGKKNKNEYFPHLDLIGSFLTPKANKPSVKPNIEVLSSVDNGCDEEESSDSDDEEDWFMEQTLPEETEALLPTIGDYGFANQTKGVLQKFPSEELTEVFDLSNPDEASASEKKERQKLKEESDFSDDHYLADLMEPPKALQTFLTSAPNWTQNEISEENLELLKNLGNKEYLLTKQEEKAVFFSLVDILFSFAYDHRTTNGMPSTESAWTINKLSATLSWLRSFTSLKETVVSCVRRSLCYPLFRHWELSILVLKDVINILTSGQTQIVKSLLTVYSLFQESEPRYLLNQLYIKDYIIWVQKVPDTKLASLRSSLESLELGKNDVDLELKELEYAAHLAQEAEEGAVVNNMMNLHLDHGDTSRILEEQSNPIQDTFSEVASDTEVNSNDTIPEVRRKGFFKHEFIESDTQGAMNGESSDLTLQIVKSEGGTPPCKEVPPSDPLPNDYSTSDTNNCVTGIKTEWDIPLHTSIDLKDEIQLQWHEKENALSGEDEKNPNQLEAFSPWPSNVSASQSENTKRVHNDEKRFSCSQCSAAFADRSNLRRHMQTHTGESPYSCSHCSASFSLKYNLTSHTRTHTGVKPFSCSHCSASFSRKCLLDRHMRIHTGEKPFICSHCSASFSQKGHLNCHMRIHTGEKRFSCSHCSASFSQKCHLNYHMRMHTGEKPFICSHCSASFSQKCLLKRHMQEHTGEKPFICSHCSASFSQKGHLNCHMRMHTGEKPFSCSHCSASFSQKCHLKRHMRMHTGEKPFICSHCSASFSQKVHLNNHMRTHTGEKSYSCSHCSASFSLKCNLTRHTRTHTGVKPFSCSHCSASFSRKGHLNCHMRMHTGEKPYSCSHCSASFSLKSALRTHIRTHASEKPSSRGHCSASSAHI